MSTDGPLNVEITSGHCIYPQHGNSGLGIYFQGLKVYVLSVLDDKPTPNGGGTDGGLSTGVIIGIVFAVLAAILLAGKIIEIAPFSFAF